MVLLLLLFPSCVTYGGTRVSVSSVTRAARRLAVTPVSPAHLYPPAPASAGALLGTGFGPNSAPAPSPTPKYRLNTPAAQPGLGTLGWVRGVLGGSPLQGCSDPHGGVPSLGHAQDPREGAQLLSLGVFGQV